MTLELYVAMKQECGMSCLVLREMLFALHNLLVVVTILGLIFQSITNQDNRTSIAPSALRENEIYVVFYIFVTKTILTELFPYVTLIFLNFCIYRQIRRSVKIQQAMRCTTHSQKEEIKSANLVVSWIFLDTIFMITRR